MNSEIWRVIEGFDDYQISSKGRVKSHKNETERILKQRITHDGYVWYNLCRQGKQYTKRANRLVAEAFIPNPDNKLTVNHIDGNKLNNCVENLEWATREEQMKHAYGLGLKTPVRGCLQANHKLSEDEVRNIRRQYKARDKHDGMNGLAREYRVSPSVIDKIVRRITYQNVE